MKTFSFIRFTLSLIAGATVLASSAMAAPVISETFTYSDGALAGSNGGTGFTNGWFTVSGDTGFNVASNEAATNATNTLFKSYRQLDTTYGDNEDGTTLYIRYDASRSAQGTTNATQGLALFNGTVQSSGTTGTEQLFFGYRDNFMRLSAGGNNDTTAGTTGLANTFLLKIDFAAGVDTLTAYVVNDINSFNTSTSANTSTTFALQFDGFRISKNPNTFDGTFDNISAGATLSDVGITAVPEPSSALLLGLGVGAMLLRRRRVS